MFQAFPNQLQRMNVEDAKRSGSTLPTDTDCRCIEIASLLTQHDLLKFSSINS